MAKWGEGDPRWIVEERADATNVNNWHWTEKDATNWSKEKLKTLLEGLKIEDDEACCEIKEVKAEGEASASNRKAKLIFFYEWVINADWSGKVAGDDTKYKGKLDIPNLSDENDASEIDVHVTVKNEKDDGYKLKEFMRKKGAQVIREKVGKYITDLKSEFSQGMILPAKDGKPASTATTNKVNSAKSKMAQPVVSENSSPVGVKIKCKKLTDTEEFKCEAADVYRALTQPEMVQAFTRAPAIFKPEKGFKFSLIEGVISGEIVELVPNEKIVQRWRHKTWPDEHYSTATITLKQKDDCTELHLVQTGVPESEVERTKEGWKRNYWQAMKQTFGFSTRIF